MLEEKELQVILHTKRTNEVESMEREDHGHHGHQSIILHKGQIALVSA